jgi:hypothetical protein
MNADVAIVNFFATGQFRDRAKAISRWIGNFGLTSEIMTARDVGAGEDGKSFLNANYRAVIFLEGRRSDDADGGANQPYSWIATAPGSGDIPIAYFGGIPVGHQASLPSDFPIINFNLAQPKTYYQYPHFRKFEAENPRGRRIGTRLNFSNGKKAWGRAVNYIWDANQWYTALYRVHPDRLDSNRQVMAWPDLEEMGIPAERSSNVAVVVRYYNRYFLPCLSYTGRGQPNEYAGGTVPGDTFCPGLVLWFLEQAGVMPRWKMAVTYDIDHPLPGTESAQGSGMSLAQIRYVDRKTMEWVRDFANSRGMKIQCGVLSGGKWRANGTQHWYYKDQGSDAIALHELLRSQHRGLLPCCWHDHTFPIGRVGDYKRHTEGEYGAPAIAAGFDWNADGSPATPGTGVRNRNFSLRTRGAYRTHWEGSVLEMQSMNIRQPWCFEQKYLNLAGNEWGNIEFLDFLVDETRVGALRITSAPILQEGLPNPYANSDFRLLKYRGLDLFETQGLDGGMRGLFNPGDGSGGVPINNLDVNQQHDLGVSESDNDRERQVRARFLALQADLGIKQYLYVNGILMNHVDFSHAANPSDPLAPFRRSRNWNGLKEVFTAIGEWYAILSNWLQPGSVQDVVSWRVRMRNP